MQNNRSFSAEPGIEVRSGPSGGSMIRGYAAMFNSPSIDLGDVIEYVKPSAFAHSLATLRENPVVCRVQHQGGLSQIGTTENGTLRLGTDSKGLWYECDMPDTSAGRDCLALIARRDISRSSFAFHVRDDGERWNWSQSPATRELIDVNLIDVAPVDKAAYNATVVEARSAALANMREAKTMNTQTQTAETPEFAEVREQDGERIGKLSILDEIAAPYLADYFPSMVSANKVRQAIDSMGPVDRIDVEINSPGGDVFEAVAIYNMLREHPAPVDVRIAGLAASAASIIAMAGDIRSVRSGGMFMVHRASTFLYGNAEDMKDTGTVLQTVDSSIADIYAERTDTSKQEWLELMGAETWMDAEESVSRGLATGQMAQAAEARDFSRAMTKFAYRNAPEQYRPETRMARIPTVAEYRSIIEHGG